MSSILLDFGPIKIYWYSVCILIAMLSGMIVVLKEIKKQNIGIDAFVDFAVYTIICAIIGARVYYVAFEWEYYSKNIIEIFEVWNGGLAIHGGIIGGFLYTLIYTKRHKIETLRITDICCVGLILGQAIGRWGNFFNHEAFGPIIEREALEGFFIPKFIIDGMFIRGSFHQPTFLYESLWNIIGFIILIFYRKRRYLKVGELTGLYLMWYSVGRFFIEALRQDSLMIFDFKVAQIVSIVLFIVGLVLFLFRKIKSSRFDYLYHKDLD